ncbi:calmodulin [Jimgerdemannia flammicorona]|uniref:Calmodulin n=1 Tax=Jimgerdemannia flammicorona TaxID=994334 RepID=A0A433AFT4_9FUNG|nr:calmodulin [Jimgerdemannia flammicorona]
MTQPLLCPSTTTVICIQTHHNEQWKEAFSLFDKKGTQTVSSDNLGDLLRALGQNPTQAEVRELVQQHGGSDKREVDIDFGTFLTVLTRTDGFKSAGTAQEFIQGFQVFDKESNGFISAGELRYVLTSLGEKLTNEEVDELLKDVEINKDGQIDYVG